MRQPDSLYLGAEVLGWLADRPQRDNPHVGYMVSSQGVRCAEDSDA